jgi:hypothetical protein
MSIIPPIIVQKFDSFQICRAFLHRKNTLFILIIVLKIETSIRTINIFLLNFCLADKQSFVVLQRNTFTLCGFYKFQNFVPKTFKIFNFNLCCYNILKIKNI